MGLGLNILGTLTSMLLYGLVIYSVYKISQIATDVSELKERIGELHHQLDGVPQPYPDSARSLMHAVSSPSYPEMNPAIPPEPQH